jgi:L-lactate dehydrogenase (cytochrome)
VISRASAAGCEALVATVDVPVVGKRERDLRTGMSIPVRLRASSAANAALPLPWLWRMLNGPEITFVAPGDDASSIGEYANRELTDPARTWDDLSLIRHRWDGPLLVKGVMSPADAFAAAENGADSIIVSNPWRATDEQCARCRHRDAANCRCGWRSSRGLPRR